MTEILLILNPAARSERAGSATENIRRLVDGDARIVLTRHAGEAKAIAQEAARKGVRIVVAAGGDGTINEVVNGVAGSETALGVLPVGTMNVFAAELGVPNRLRDAWRVIRAGHLRTIDLARANRHYFVQLAGVGLDAQVVKETSRTSKRNFGPLSYLFSTAQIASRKPPRIIAEADGRTVEGSFILIGNGRFYGGPIAFFKKARVDDGLLDVLIFKKMGHLDLARYFAHIVMGRHTSLSDVEYFQAEKVQMHSADNVPVEVDGELTTELPVTFRISSKKLRVAVPRGWG
jgi:YegS/Rv2252/BmrU family lipid kinase